MLEGHDDLQNGLKWVDLTSRHCLLLNGYFIIPTNEIRHFEFGFLTCDIVENNTVSRFQR